MTRTLRIHISPRRLLMVAALLGALALALGLLTHTTTTPAKASQTAASISQPCSVKTLQGNYGGNISGTSTASGPLALQALATFNGNGTGTAAVTIKTETTLTFTTETLTYTLNSNCSGTLRATQSDGTTANYTIVVTLLGTKLDLLQADEGFVTTGDLNHV
jgi:hypothetical protein